jgi:hypothetical protein
MSTVEVGETKQFFVCSERLIGQVVRCAMMRLTSDSQPARAARGEGKAIPQHKIPLHKCRAPLAVLKRPIAHIARRGLWSVAVLRV